jgi:hypothetical protein
MNELQVIPSGPRSRWIVLVNGPIRERKPPEGAEVVRFARTSRRQNWGGSIAPSRRNIRPY